MKTLERGQSRRHQRASSSRRSARGATLIEVLVAVVVLSIGLLGLAGLQLTSLQSNYSAYQRSQATWLAYDIADRMRANRANALIGNYDIDFADPAIVCDPTPTLSGTLANQDLTEWRNGVACLLPEGNARINRNDNVVTISIRWDDSRGGTEDDGALTFEFRTEL